MKRRTITLKEFVPSRFASSDIPTPVGEAIWRNYETQVHVEFPSPKTNQEWELTPSGWVGYLPITSDFGLWLQPKIPLSNLFHMLD
jgi:5-methylcytosine-specific restriction enzyme subunit McrC